MLGIPKEIPHARIMNFITLASKFYVYRHKLYYEANLDLTAFLQELRNKLKVEKYICNLEGREDRFSIWNNVLNALG